MQAISVSSLNEQIKSVVETTFDNLLVEGELSRITYHGSGHIYFTLKDDDSSIKAVCFRSVASRLKFTLEEGQSVIISGSISLYKPRGEYQIIASSIEPSGVGALHLAYEQLKAKLKDDGYFDEERKKQLPKFVKRVALVTSATGAALQDMLRVASNRFRLVELVNYDVLVQGDEASGEIASAIKLADESGFDVIVVARGGGSIEDLWAFNEKVVADAIFEAKTPIVSAVGHEIDWVISDYVADLRAATPSSAMELILPDTKELLLGLDLQRSHAQSLLWQLLRSKKEQLEHIRALFASSSSEQKIIRYKESLQNIKALLDQQITFRLSSFTDQLALLKKMIESLKPKSKKGFVQISKDATLVELGSLDVGDEVDLMSESFALRAKILQKRSLS
ncbi:MAG: exodeoxyribonuclease VII large subunit [Sulfuricurvum sp.]